MVIVDPTLILFHVSAHRKGKGKGHPATGRSGPRGSG
jgi:hypothetical protein